MTSNIITLRNLFYGVLFSIRNCFIVIKYETTRYLLSNRTLFLVVFCFVPTLLYVSYAGETASLNIDLHRDGYQWFVGYLLQIYITFAYIINILISIVVIQELFLHESAIEILLSSTKRFELYVGKTVSALIVIVITSIFTWIACVLAFITWKQDLPISFDQFLSAFILLIAESLVPLMVTILGNTMVMKFKSLSGMGSGIPVFVFFVIPFFIFSSIYLGFASEDILEFSTYFRVFLISNFHFMTEDERIATHNDVNNAITFLVTVFTIAVVFSWIFFLKMETRKKD
ncbi:MAG: hypothetical protein ACFFBQ_06865 [Promethearchaeota archaeon]